MDSDHITFIRAQNRETGNSMEYERLILGRAGEPGLKDTNKKAVSAARFLWRLQAFSQAVTLKSKVLRQAWIWLMIPANDCLLQYLCLASPIGIRFYFLSLATVYVWVNL